VLQLLGFSGQFLTAWRLHWMNSTMNNVQFSFFAFILTAAISATACSETTATPTSPSAGSGSLSVTASQLSGTWTLTTLQTPGQASRPAPAGYTLSFADGRVSTRADCNVCNGSFTVSGATLTTGPLMACTLAACPTMEFESLYTTILGGEHTVELSGKSLSLSSARGRLTFTQ
jgi:heat shock protein HslJ